MFLDLGLDLNQIRLVHLHLCISLIIVFYQCLRLLFSNINNNYLFLLSLIIFLSPTFRSLAIWPDSRLPGLIFFVLTIYFFLKFRKTDNLKYTWYTCISLVVSSYISPNFSVFFVYFFFFFLHPRRPCAASLRRRPRLIISIYFFFCSFWGKEEEEEGGRLLSSSSSFIFRALYVKESISLYFFSLPYVHFLRLRHNYNAMLCSFWRRKVGGAHLIHFPLPIMTQD